ncbi:MAG: hypothetical protein ACO1RX_06025 [Candidatus Sericytochromatia bacterium]
MLPRFIPALLLTLILATPVQAQTPAEPAPLSDWSLEVFGGGMTYGGQNYQLKARTRLGVLIGPYLEGGLQVGGNLQRSTYMASADDTAMSGISDTQRFALGLDMRWYPWTTAQAFQPFLAGGIDLFGNNWFIPSASLSVGSHWHFTEHLGLTAQIGFNTASAIDPSLGLRYRF